MLHERRSTRGMTLVEVVIALALFATFASSAFLAIDSASQSYRTENAVAQLDFVAHEALEDVSERLRLADFGSITPAPLAAPSSSSQLDYQAVIGFQGGAVQWGPVERLAFEADPQDPENGLDDDGDGVTDEGRLVWWSEIGGRRVSLCAQVAATLDGETAGNGIDDNGNGLVDERGFCVEFTGERAIARITLAQTDAAGRTLTRSAVRTVTPRNTPEEE